MSAAPVEFAYELTPELSRAATRRLFQHHLGWRAPTGLAAYAAACIVLLLTGATLLPGIFIGAGLLLAGMVAMAYVTRVRRNAALLAAVADHSALCRVTDDALELHNELGHSTFRWGLVRKVVRFPDVWLVFIGQQPLWLPAGPLQGEPGERLLEMASRVGATVV